MHHVLDVVVAAAQLGDTPVEQHRLAEGAQHHVLGLDVAVDDAALVRIGDGLAELHEVGEQLQARAAPVLLERVGQRAAAHQAHGAVEVAGGGALAQLVDRDHARVLELASDARLAQEALLRVARAARQELLEGDVAAHVAVVRDEDRRLAAARQLALQLVVAGLLAGQRIALRVGFGSGRGVVFRDGSLHPGGLWFRAPPSLLGHGRSVCHGPLPCPTSGKLQGAVALFRPRRAAGRAGGRGRRRGLRPSSSPARSPARRGPSAESPADRSRTPPGSPPASAPAGAPPAPSL